jgi:hypothetical protein
LCGPRNYTIYQYGDDSIDFRDKYDFLQLIEKEDQNNPEHLQLKLTGSDKDSLQTIDVYLKVWTHLINWSRPFSVTDIYMRLTQCIPYRFYAEGLEDLYFQVGNAKLNQPFEFDTRPCDEEITGYRGTLIKNGQEKDLPDFISIYWDETQELPWIEYDSTTGGDVGEHDIRIYAFLDTIFPTELYVDYKVTVVAPEWDYEPYLFVELEDQYYDIGFKLNFSYCPDYRI